MSTGELSALGHVEFGVDVRRSYRFENIDPLYIADLIAIVLVLGNIPSSGSCDFVGFQHALASWRGWGKGELGTGADDVLLGIYGTFVKL